MRSIGTTLRENPKYLLNDLIANLIFEREFRYAVGKKRTIALILLFWCLIHPNAYSSTWHPVIGVGGGVAAATNLNQATTFPILNPVTDEAYTYTPTNMKQTSALGEIFIGAERVISPNWLIQPGLAYAQINSYTAKGTLLQGADLPSSDLYQYQFKVLTRQLLVQGKLMRSYRETFYPFVLLGLGSSFNSATNFSTTVPPFLTFTRQYANHSSSTFAYRVGLGVDVAILRHARIGIGYRYAGLGGIRLGAANIDNIPVPGTLSQSNINANEVLAQFTVIV